MNTYEQIRETLVTIRALATCGGTDFGNPAIRGLLDQMDTIRAMAQSALKAPARNCDVGTAEERIDRFGTFCISNKTTIPLPEKCTRCRVRGEANVHKCMFEWEQMPYTAESEVKE